MAGTFFHKRNDFSESHYKLPNSYGMFDIDIHKAQWLNIDNISNKEESTYIEYRCLKHDRDQNRFNLDRIKFIAIFELKYKITDLIKSQLDNIIPGSPLWGVFMLAKKLQCKFFLVIASEGKSPFYFCEYNINTNKRLKTKKLSFDYKNDSAEVINHFWNNSLNITNG